MTDDIRPGAAGRAVVTGASSGIGLAAALELARRGWALALVGRDPDRLATALAQVRAAAGADTAAQAYRCDFDSLGSVRELGAALLDAYPSIDVLANNAGGAFQPRVTGDGLEVTIQVNHLSPFLLSHLLRPALAGGRIVNTASDAHGQGRLDPADLGGAGVTRTMARYGSAKQANILFAAEAARRWPEIVSTSFHPGVVRTRFGNEHRMIGAFIKVMPGLRTPAKGAQTLVWLATTAEPVSSGGYYVDCRQRSPQPRAADAALAARLWQESEKAVGIPA